MWDFELVTLEKTQPPVNGDTGSWYRYVIANKITEVSGHRRGSKREVTEFVVSNIKRLNARHLTVASANKFALN